MLVEDDLATPPPATAAEENERFATAVTTRALHTLPHLLRDAPAKVDTVLLQLESMAKTAAAKGESRLLLGTLRRALACVVRDNDGAMPRVSAALHKLASALPAGSRGGDVAAGLLLLFAHGLGEALAAPPPASPPGGEALTPRNCKVVLLGFAGGTPSDLLKYSSRLGYGDAENVCASEIPEVYEASMDLLLDRLRAAAPRPWAIHLFSKAGFLMLARLLRRLDGRRLQEERGGGAARTPLPSAIIWDSSPGAMADYREFVSGTWAAAEKMARAAAPSFAFSKEARARMDRLLHSAEYAPAVRDSYAPMQSLNVQPGEGACHGLSLPAIMPEACHHLFLYSERDPVCSPDEIRQYCSALASAVTGGASCHSVRIGGTHCDGLFWSGAEYTAAVRKTLALCV